jgi:hypothetical protein
MKYCARCILPESYPGIVFDEEGVCNYCLEYEPDRQAIGKAELLEIVAGKERTGPYDCIVPMSGGKDSTYILYYIVKELRLRPLAVSYNSGYQHEIAATNVRTACEVLNVPLEEVYSPGEIQSRLLNAGYVLSKKLGRIWGCANCAAILRVLPVLAANRHRVPFVFYGDSRLEAVANKKSETAAGGGIRNKLLKMGKTVAKDPSLAYHGSRYIYWRMRQRLALGFPFSLVVKPFAVPEFSDENPTFIHFYDYVSWDSIKNVGLLETEVGWKHPVGRDTRFDCTLECISNLWYLKDYGISHVGVNLCNVVREGRMSREGALTREEEVKKTAQAEYDELIRKIG